MPLVVASSYRVCMSEAIYIQFQIPNSQFLVLSSFCLNFGENSTAMAEVILMPRLSDTMTEGVIAAWHKKVGDTIKKGDLLAEIETDKATMELESYKDGTLLHIGTGKGGKLQVNDLLAIIGAKGEDISSLIKKGGQASEGSESPKKAEP